MCHLPPGLLSASELWRVLQKCGVEITPKMATRLVQEADHHISHDDNASKHGGHHRQQHREPEISCVANRERSSGDVRVAAQCRPGSGGVGAQRATRCSASISSAVVVRMCARARSHRCSSTATSTRSFVQFSLHRHDPWSSSFAVARAPLAPPPRRAPSVLRPLRAARFSPPWPPPPWPPRQARAVRRLRHGEAPRGGRRCG